MKLLTLRMLVTVLLSFYFALAVPSSHAAIAGNVIINAQAQAANTKKVCNTQKDKKGKEVQVCKEVRVHKKLDSATKVPPK